MIQATLQLTLFSHLYWYVCVEILAYLPDAMQTNCAKCTDKQKEISGTVIGHLVHNYKDLYEQLLQKYDPDGSFRRQMEGGGEDDEDEDDEQNK